MSPVPTGFVGLVLLPAAAHRDARGEVRKVVTGAGLAAAGLDPHIEEVLDTSNYVAGTVRGMHFQMEPMAESKTLWVTRGALFDCVVDLRRLEPTYGKVWSITLSADDGLALHIPPGFAHGYQTLDEDTRLTYLISAPYSPGHSRTLAWDDPVVSIPWPRPVTHVSNSDQEGLAWSDLP